MAQTPAQDPNQDQNFDYLDHPTLGKLAFPKEMPAEERNESIQHLIVKKYGLPEDTDLSKEYQQQKTLPRDMEKFSRAYQEYNPEPRKESTWEKIKRFTGTEEGFLTGARVDREGVHFGPGTAFGPGGGALRAPDIATPFIMGGTEAAAYPLAAGAKRVVGTLGPIGRAIGRFNYRPQAGVAREAEEGAEGAAAAAPKPLPSAGEVPGTIPLVPRVPTPSADVQLDAVAMNVFGKHYGDLTDMQQRVVARRTGGGPPGGIERRVTQGEGPVMERRAGAMPLPTQAKVPLVATPTPAPLPKAPPGPSGAAGGAAGTLPRAGPPAAPPPMTLGGPGAPRTLSEAAEQATGATAQKPLPNVPLNQQLRRGGAPAVAPEDPLKAEFPDPKIRQFARANGAELVRAAGDRPEVLQAVHNLTNVEVRQAGINSGIDLGDKHVGSRMNLGPGQVSRQDLIDQMIKNDVKPEDIPNLAKPRTAPIALENLREGDTFVDEKGEPRRIVEITKNGTIKTADGTLRNYKGEVVAQGQLNSPRAQLARGGRFHPGEEEPQQPSPLPNVPAALARGLLADEIQFLKGRPILQRNVVAAYRAIAPMMEEMKNVARAGYGLGGWWQRFMDAFEATGASTEAAEMRAAGPTHTEALKAVHSSLSGNKLVETANKISWGVYRDWLEAGRPTSVEAIDAIIKRNRGMSGGVVPEAERVAGRKVANLDTQKMWQLVNSPEFQGKVPFHGNAFVGSPVEGLTEGSQKLPSMVATTAGKGNLKRVVFDTHMRDLYGLNNLTDAQYIAASMHIREIGASMGLEAGEAQEQMWGTVLALKSLLGKGLSPKAAAAAYSRDILAATNKDYAQIILDMLNKGDKEMMQIMADLKKYGFDPGGPVAREKLEAIVRQGSQRMAERARPISRQLLTRTARRIASMGAEE